MKFLLDIGVTGSARKDLMDIQARLIGMQNQMAKMQEAPAQMAAGWSGMRSSVVDVGESLRSLHDWTDRMGSKLVDTVGDLSRQVYKDAATFEDLASDMRFAFGDRSADYFAAAEREAAKLTFSMKDVVSVVSSLKRQKVDLFGPDLENIKTYKTKTGELITGLEVIQDAADAAGRDASRMLFSMREAFSGDFKSLKDALDLSSKDVDEFKKAMAKGKDETQKADLLLGKISERFGGAGRERVDNFNKTFMQLPDLIEQINAAAGKEGLREITKGFKSLVEALTEFKKDKSAMVALTSFFHVIGMAVGGVVRGAAALVRFAGALLSMAPWLGPVAAGLTLVTVGVSLLTFAAVGAGAAVAGLVTGIAALSATAMVAGAAAMVLFGGLIIAGTAALAAFGLVAYATAQTIQSNYGGVAKTFTDIKLVVGAIGELYASYNGTAATMSKSTAEALQKEGLLGVVQRIYMTGHRVAVFFRTLGNEMTYFGARLAPVIIPMLNEVKALFSELASALGLNIEKFNASGQSTQVWANYAKEAVTALVDLTRAIVGVVRESVQIARTTVFWGRMALYVMNLGGSFGEMGAIAKGALNALMLPARAVAAVLGAIVGAVKSVIKMFAVMKMATTEGLTLEEAGKKFDDMMPKKEADAARQGVSWTPNQMVKAWEGDTSPWKAGDLRDGRRLTDEEASSLNLGTEIGRSQAGGTDFAAAYQAKMAAQYAEQSKGTPFGPPTAEQAGAANQEQVAAAVSKVAESNNNTASKLDAIAAAIANFAVTIEIDGAAIARATNGAKEAYLCLSNW